MTRKLITKEIREEILRRNKEESLTIKELCKEYGFYYTSFFNHLKRNNIQTDVITNKSKINHYYFSKIDTEEKAYFLGLLFADGYIEAPNKNSNGKVCLRLSKPDIYMVEALASAICPENTVRYRKAYIDSRNWNIKESAEISFTSKIINNDLNNLGMLYGKSKLGRIFPNINKDLIRHFIRGYFEGDGCLCIKQGINVKKVEISFYCPDKYFLESISEYTTNSVISQSKNGLYSLRLNNTLNKYNFLNFLYKDCSIYLYRKYNLYTSLNFDGRYFI